MGLLDKGLGRCIPQIHCAVAPLTPEKLLMTCEIEDGHVNQAFRKEFINLHLLLGRAFMLLCARPFATPPLVLPPAFSCSLSTKGNLVGAQNPSAQVSGDAQGSL